MNQPEITNDPLYWRSQTSECFSEPFEGLYGSSGECSSGYEAGFHRSQEARFRGALCESIQSSALNSLRLLRQQTRPVPIAQRCVQPYPGVNSRC